MISFVSVLTSLLLATVGATATPVQARAGSCIPTLIPSTGANFVNGQMQLGVFFYGVGQTIQMKNLTVPLVPTFVGDPSGNGLVSVVPPPGAATLYPTSANGQITLQQRITTSPKNLTGNRKKNWLAYVVRWPRLYLNIFDWVAIWLVPISSMFVVFLKWQVPWQVSVICREPAPTVIDPSENCEDPNVAYGCSIISLADTTQCVEAGTTAGQLALVKKCAGLRYGSQIFDMYVETLA
ncbi:hypothetical protein C8J57DRAFT_1220232 [Mycena rebaudengoi]|nr:hypothetical protein C8J57DRAFT_1220232 [Mycena rebaudengoi]